MHSRSGGGALHPLSANLKESAHKKLYALEDDDENNVEVIEVDNGE